TTLFRSKEVSEKATEVVKGISQANGTRVEISEYECPYEDTVINYKLAEILTEKYKELGVEDIKPVNEVGAGSTDVGAVSYKCPTIQGNIQIVPENVSAHTTEMADATITLAGKEGLVNGATGIAFSALELLLKPELLEEVQKEQEETLANI